MLMLGTPYSVLVIGNQLTMVKRPVCTGSRMYSRTRKIVSHKKSYRFGLGVPSTTGHDQ